MTRIDFHSNVPDTMVHTCKLVRKALAAGQFVVCHTSDAQTLTDLDRALWSMSPTDFIPHVLASDPLAPQTPVLLSSGAVDVPLTHTAVLVNLDLQLPPNFSRFARLIEIVGREEAHKVAARERFRFYRTRGYAMQHHDFSAH